MAFALIFSASGAAAIGLGPAELRSGLGEPLRLSLPVLLQSGEDVGCVQVKPHGDDLPGVFNTRASVVQVRGQTRLEISSAQPVNEPAVGLIVTVGCTSPVARDYVLFLDPPPVSAAVSARETAGGANDAALAKPQTQRADRGTRANRSSAATRRTAPRRADDSAAADASSRTRRSAASAAARDTTRETLPRKVRPPTDSGVPKAADRLTVAPVEEPRVGSGRSEKPGSTATPAAADSQRPASPAPAAPALDQSTPASAAALPSGANEELAREEERQRQQRDLQRQIKVLGDQVLALRTETATLNTRNQMLADSAFPKYLGWLFALLALLAMALAAWIAWRYGQLRRAVAGDPWWGNTVFGGNTEGVSRAQAGYDARAGSIARKSVSSTTGDEATTTPMQVADRSSPSIPNGTERARPAMRPSGKRFTSALESDFTASDIEAAMATVRTVPPPRAAAAVTSLEDSDFAALGGPSLPSPFADPPPPPPFADPPPPPPVADNEEKTEDLDFRLDLPPAHAGSSADVPIDPLATTNNLVTEIESPQAVDFELPLVPTALDFELPHAATVVEPPAGTPDKDEADNTVRHAASVLDSLFPTLGVDTILRLDYPGEPLMSTEVEADEREAEQASVKFRLVRFADLIGGVDETALTDPLRAIAQLRQHVLRDERIPTLMWLRLFQLYRRVDKKAVYEALADHFARRYRRPMVKWDESLADRTPQIGLSALPEIDRNIVAQWGTELGLEMLRSLLCDRDQPDAVIFNALLQRDLLEAAKVFPLDDNQLSNLGPNL